MGRITISIPDDLEAAVDARAKERGIAVSQLVAEALRAHLAPAPATPSPTTPPPDAEDHAVRAYVSELSFQVERVRRTVADFTSKAFVPLEEPLPDALPRPPWPTPQP